MNSAERRRGNIPQIHVFKSIDDAVSRLEKYRYKNTPSLTVDDLVHATSGNTFRAFRKTGNSPSKIFRHWAYRYFKKIVDDMGKTKTQHAYDKKLSYWVSGLQKEWSKKSRNRLDFGRAAKLVNLLARDIAESINPDTRKFYVSNRRVQKFLHVPFDSFSLRPLRKIVHDLADAKIPPIPSNATMKYVETRKQYMTLQKAVRKLCRKANVPPILYENWSWRRTH